MYRIGELAKIVNVSKRTIDYYTNIGLLQASRSKGNYRIYSKETIDDLRFIDECKELHLPLEEIKRKLEIKKADEMRETEVEEQIRAIAQQMKLLHNELTELLPFIQKLDTQTNKTAAKKLASESSSLLQSLLRITD